MTKSPHRLDPKAASSRRKSGSDEPGSALHNELADLGVQTLDLALGGRVAAAALGI
jgi:hypothetical protein